MCTLFKIAQLRAQGVTVFYNLNGTQERGPVPDAPAVCVPTACTSYKHPNGQCLTLVVSYIIAPTAASVDAMRSDMRNNMCSRVIHVLVLKLSSLCLQVRCLPRQLPVKVTPPIPFPLTACSLAHARRLSARICNFFSISLCITTPLNSGFNLSYAHLFHLASPSTTTAHQFHMHIRLILQALASQPHISFPTHAGASATREGSRARA